MRPQIENIRVSADDASQVFSHETQVVHLFGKKKSKRQAGICSNAEKWVSTAFVMGIWLNAWLDLLNAIHTSTKIWNLY